MSIKNGLFRHCHVLVFSLAFVTACKPKADSSLSDAATTSSYKTGFFVPKLKKDFSARSNTKKKAITPHQFLEVARKLTNRPTMTLWKPEGTEFAVTSAADGEQILLVFTKNDIPDPIMSITTKSKVYTWGPYIKMTKEKTTITDLFIRRSYKAGDKESKAEAGKNESEPLDVKDMFVRRMAMNDDGFAEPVLVPWLSHVGSETGNAVVYRLGNTIMDARTTRPALEFRKVGEGPAWVVVGKYDDGDVKGGTVFFRKDAQIYYSVTPGKSTATKWKLQDEDSVDRIGKVTIAKEDLPREVRDYLDTVPDESSKKHPKNITPTGFDWLEGDSGVIQLERNDLTFGNSSSGGGLGLTGNEPAEKEFYTDEDYKDGFGLSWYNPASWWADNNKPLRTTGAVGSSNLQGVVYTDQSGTQHGGVMLSQRNDPNGNRIYSVLNRTNNTVTEVNADGSTRGSPIARSDYEARANGHVGRMETMRSSGELQQADSRAIRSAQSLDARAQRQLERSESLVPGSTVGEMAGGIIGKTAVSAVNAEAKEQVKNLTGNTAGYDRALDRALVGQATRTLTNGAPESIEGATNQGEAFLFDFGKDYAREVAKVQAGGGRTGDIASEAVNVAADTGRDAYKRYENGDFSTTNPDYAFDSQVSLAGIGGTAVSGTAGSLVKMQIPKDTVGRAAAGDAVKNTTGALFNSAEAYSRASYAGTLTNEAGGILDQRIEMRQREQGYNDGLGALNSLDQQESQNALPPQPQPQYQPSPTVAPAPAPAPAPAGGGTSDFFP